MDALQVYVHFVVMAFTWMLITPEAVSLVDSCPDRCYCFTVSRKTPPPNALLYSQYILTDEWIEGNKAIACWGRPKIPQQIPSDTKYLVLIGSEKPKRRHRSHRQGFSSASRGQGMTIRNFRTYAFQSLVDFRRRNIRLVPEGAFANLREVLHIDMHGNKIKDLQHNTFKELLELENINLSDNRLKFLHPQLFEDSLKLKKLDFSGNFLRSLPEEILRTNQMIEYLDASDNLLSGIREDVFQTLGRVKFLNLSHNRINDNSPMMFTGLLTLTELYLQNNKFARIDAPLFLSNTQLRTLDLSHNRIKTISHNALQNQFNLETLDLTGNVIQVLDTFSYRGALALRTLDLSHNHVNQITGYSFTGLNNFTSLNLKGNRLTNITKLMFGIIPSLTHLNLADNNISMIEPDSFAGLDNVELLDLSGNALRRLVVQTFAGMSGLMDLNLADNRLVVIQPDAFMTTEFPYMSRLMFVNLHDNKLMELQRSAFRGTPSLRVLTVSKNRLGRVVPEFFSSFNRLHRLILSDNILETIPSGTFRLLNYLETLDLSNNSLHEISDGAFRGLEELSNLNLGHNALTNANMNWLKPLTSIKTLRLDSNRFTGMSSTDFENKSRLRFLYLSNNNIAEISIANDSRLYLYNLTLAHNRLTSARGIRSTILPGRALDLSSNPWNCSCSTVLRVSDLIKNHGIRFHREDDMRCRTPGNLLNRRVGELARGDINCTGEDILVPPRMSSTTPLPGTMPVSPITSPTLFYRAMRWSWVAVIWDSSTGSPICNGALVSSSFVLTSFECLNRVANIKTNLQLVSRCPNPLASSCEDSTWRAPSNLEIKLGYEQRTLKNFLLLAETYRVHSILKVSPEDPADESSIVLLQLMPHIDMDGPASVIEILGGNFPPEFLEGKRVLASGWWIKERHTSGVDGRQKRRHYRISSAACEAQNDVHRPFLCGELEQDLVEFTSWDALGAPVSIRIQDQWVLIGLLVRHEGSVGIMKDVRQDRARILQILEEETIPQPVTHPY